MKLKSSRGVKFLARASIVAALYALLTIFLPMLSYGVLQFRAAESLTLLPILFVEAVPGLTIGCLIANIVSPWGWSDLVFGTFATFLASILTRVISTRKIFRNHNEIMPVVASLPPIFINAIILPLTWYIFAGEAGFFINMWIILATQSAVIFILGIPLYYSIKRTGIHLK